MKFSQAIIDTSHVSVAHAATAAGVAIALYFAVWAIYVLYFHPLARYPGPKTWLLFRLPYARSLRNGTVNHRQREMHQKYGHVVRYGTNELSFTDPRAWSDIHGFHGSAEKNFDRDSRWYQPAPNGARSILAAPNAAHAKIRRLVAPGFTEKALKEQELLLQGYVDLLVEKLRGRGGAEPVNMADYFLYTTFDIAGDLTYGESFGCLERENYHAWLKVMMAHFRRLVIGGSILIVLPFLRPFIPYLIPKKVQEEAKQRFDFTVEKVGQRLALTEDASRPDFMTYIARSNSKLGLTMARGELEATFDLLVSAGSETTAAALTGTVQYLLRNPEKLNKLKGEVRSSFASGGAIDVASTASLPYLTAVIKEGMRLCPPAPTIRPRVVPQGGAVVCGQFVPENTSVGIPYFSIFRSSLNFAQPDAFIPERWIAREKGGIQMVPHEAKAFQPFSYGPRDCLGKSLAWAEMRLTLAKLVWHFDWENESPANRWEKQDMFIMWEMEPAMMRMLPATH